MAAQTVHFMTGSSKTLAQSLLTKLFKGQSRISILPFAAQKDATLGGIKWEELSFAGADEIFTLKDSFTTTKADDTEDKIQIDQKSGATIDTSISERGEWTIEGNIPVITKEWANVFYPVKQVVASSKAITGQDGTTTYTANAYGMESNKIEVCMLIENSSVDRGLAFARVSASLVPVFESGSPAYFKLKGTVLANTDSAGTQGDWAILEKYTI